MISTELGSVVLQSILNKLKTRDVSTRPIADKGDQSDIAIPDVVVVVGGKEFWNVGTGCIWSLNMRKHVRCYNCPRSLCFHS